LSEPSMEKEGSGIIISMENGPPVVR